MTLKARAFALVVLFLPTITMARTRQEVIDSAQEYSSFPWKPRLENLLDEKNCSVILSNGVLIATMTAGSNDIDDRREKPVGDKCVTNDSNWPFEVCSTCTYHGEAYSLADDPDVTWGWESTSSFKARLEHVSERWIAGRTRSAQTLPTSGYYTGFTGIDCSGFVSRLWATENPPLSRRHLGTGEIPGYTLSIDRRTQLKPGDILNKPGKPGVPGHVVVFLEWEEEPVTAKIVHAAPRTYAENHLSADVHYDLATLTGDIIQPGTIDVRYNSGYDARSAFPQFAWTSPTKENPELDPLVPAIELTITSKQNIVVSSVTLVIDEGKPGAVVITPGTTGYALAPSTSNSTHVSVRYEFPPDLALSSGPHSVTAYAGNIIGLNDISSMTFQVVPGTNPPTIAWADYGGPGELFGERKGSNTIETAPWLHTEGVGLYLKPDRNLLRGFNIHADDTLSVPLSSMTFVAGVRSVAIDTALSGFEEKTGYYARLADVMANTTTMYFHLDKVGPVIETTVTVRLDGTGTGFVFDAAGRAVDSMSGLGGEVLLSTGSGTVPLYAGQSWPTGPAEMTYAFAGLLGDYSVLAYDRSGWPGHFNLQFSTDTQNLRMSNRDSDWYGGAGNAGTILKEARLVVSGLSPELPPNSYWVIPPEGMKMELWADSEDMDMPDFPVQYGHPRTSQVKLLERTVNGTTVEGIFDRPMKAQINLRLEPGYNTNSGTYRTHVDTDDDGFFDAWVDTEAPAGRFFAKIVHPFSRRQSPAKMTIARLTIC